MLPPCHCSASLSRQLNIPCKIHARERMQNTSYCITFHLLHSFGNQTSRLNGYRKALRSPAPIQIQEGLECCGMVFIFLGKHPHLLPGTGVSVNRLKQNLYVRPEKLKIFCGTINGRVFQRNKFIRHFDKILWQI